MNSENRLPRTEDSTLILQHSVLGWEGAMRQILLCLSVIAVIGAAASAVAQQPNKLARIGFLSSSDNRFAFDGFRQELKELGYIEGKNIVIEFRTAEAKRDRIPGLVAELVQLNVDVLVSTSQLALETAKQATKAIPIVMLANFDPVATGLVASLARPGENITGLTTLARDLSAKRLELFKEAVPGISRVGLLWDPNTLGPVISFKEYESAARDLKIPLQSLEVRGPSPDFEGAFQAAVKGRVSALISIANSLLLDPKWKGGLIRSIRKPTACSKG